MRINKTLLIGLTLLLSLNFVFAYEISLTNLKDAYGFAGDPDTNVNSNTLYIGADVGVGTPTTAYITFNSSEIPEGAVIISATLGLYNYFDEGTPTSNVYHIYDDWLSNDGTQILGESELSWSNQTCGTAFDNDTNCNLTILDSISTTGAGWITFDVTEALNSNSDDILSLALNGTGAGGENTYHQTYSRDYADDPSLRPYLNVTYTFYAEPNITYDGDYVIYTYTEDGIFNISQNINATILIVGGGGAGGSRNDESGAGGGAGGLLYAEDYTITSGVHTITVGLGGISIVDTQGGNGEDSAFNSIIAYGGGGGGASSGTVNMSGISGGSGGGASTGGTVGSSIQTNYSGFTAYGYAGGGGGSYVAGGGGGAFEVGYDGSAPSTAGNGGNGTCFNITGTITCYAGGGGGGYSTAGVGGLGGGGHGCDGTGATYTFSTDGVNGTGSGGGGEGWCAGTYGDEAGNGGSGIVIIKFFNGTEEEPEPTCFVVSQSGNYSITGGVIIADSESPFLGENVNITYDYAFLTSGVTGDVIDDTNESLASVSSWFGIIITLVVMVVLVILTILIVRAVRPISMDTA